MGCSKIASYWAAIDINLDVLVPRLAIVAVRPVGLYLVKLGAMSEPIGFDIIGASFL